MSQDFNMEFIWNKDTIKNSLIKIRIKESSQYFPSVSCFGTERWKESISTNWILFNKVAEKINRAYWLKAAG